jgi:hypothetical protein
LTPVNPAFESNRRIWILRESQPDVAHLLAIFFPLVRRHVHDEQTAPGPEHAAPPRHGGRGRRQMVEHEHERRGVERLAIDRERLERAASQLDAVESRDARLGR